MKQEHTHEYEAIYHPTPTPQVKALGIRGMEIRECRTCKKQMPFLLLKEGWTPLFDDDQSDDKEILLA